jgi:ABC-type antimicrobial peptide transport system, permease component
MARYRGSDEVNRIEILATSAREIPDLIEQVENTLLQTHRGIRDFEVRTQDERLAELRKLERSFTFSMGGIAAISLLVGGLGIMNVMLASVSERIREIGVRKAIGARSHDIFIQFLAEAVVISVLGGLLGLVASVGLLSVAREIIPEGENIGLVPVGAMIIGFLFSSGVGLLSASIQPCAQPSSIPSKRCGMSSDGRELERLRAETCCRRASERDLRGARRDSTRVHDETVDSLRCLNESRSVETQRALRYTGSDARCRQTDRHRVDCHVEQASLARCRSVARLRIGDD